MKKNGEIMTLNVAHRERDHVTLGEEGMTTLHLLLGMARREHRNWLKKNARVTKAEDLSKWSRWLLHADKVIERLFFSAKKVVVEVDWDKWAEIEKELEKENRKFNR